MHCSKLRIYNQHHDLFISYEIKKKVVDEIKLLKIHDVTQIKLILASKTRNSINVNRKGNKVGVMMFALHSSLLQDLHS